MQTDGRISGDIAWLIAAKRRAIAAMTNGVHERQAVLLSTRKRRSVPA